MEYDLRLCQIVDAHYFRGRLSASEAKDRDLLLYHERVFDDILMNAGVTTHYLPLRSGNKMWQEKGIDVWLALEAFEMSFYKRFSVLVLIAGDGDYLPLVRKLNSLGTRVMVLGWDFQATNESGHEFNTRTSHDLLSESTYPVLMDGIINDAADDDPLISQLFVPTRSHNSSDESHETDDEGLHFTSTVQNIKEGYGFINRSPNNIFFHHTALVNAEFADLNVGDVVSYEMSSNDRGEDIAIDIRLMGEKETTSTAPILTDEVE